MDNPKSSDKPVLIAGGGIGGLVTALTLHQIGVPCTVFESVSELKPLGVGINLQPNAVRELYDLNLGSKELDQIGVPIEEWALVGRNGKEIYSEPRGLAAGYHWPQYAVHRGQLQMLLYRAVLDRLGPEAVLSGHKVMSYHNQPDLDTVTVRVKNDCNQEIEVEGALLVAADGLHSTVRAQMYPDQPPVQWGGGIMWRGTCEAVPVRTGASFIGLGTHDHRFVFYPISPPDENTGLATINWIAEIHVDNSSGLMEGNWNKKANLEDFLPHFANWNYEWLDVPGLLQQAEAVYEYPMIDRDPVPSWIDGNVALLGDAAHVMYPVGSNGASQAVIDARVLGAEILKHGVNHRALESYNERLCAAISQLVLRNRGSGPFGLLSVIEERCDGNFSDVDSVMPREEREAYMAKYKKAAGFFKDALNGAPQTIPL